MAKSRFKSCVVCGKGFRLYARRGRKEQSCCSRKCSGSVVRKRTTLVCQNCGTDFVVHNSHLGTKHTGKFCSIKCTHEAFKNGTFIYNRKNGPNRGRYVDPQGYVIVWNNGKHCREHRLVMEKVLGRDLHRYETIHHKNGDRADNRPENLEVWVGRHPMGVSTNHDLEQNQELKQRISELEQEVNRLKGELK